MLASPGHKLSDVPFILFLLKDLFQELASEIAAPGKSPLAASYYVPPKHFITKKKKPFRKGEGFFKRLKGNSYLDLW